MSKYEAHAVRTLHTTRHFSSRIHSLFKAHWRATLQCIDDSGLGQNDRVLDYGCGEMPFKSVLTDRGCEVAGADFAGNPHAVFEVGPKGELDPDLTAKFDAVLSTQVLEHVSDPSYYLKEAHRVLKPQGLLLLSTHGHYCYHADPTDYWRWTHEGLKLQVERAGFDIIRFYGVFSPFQTALQMLQDSIITKLPRGIRTLYVICFQLCISAIGKFQKVPPQKDALLYLVTASKQKDKLSDSAGESARELNEEHRSGTVTKGTITGGS